MLRFVGQRHKFVTMQARQPRLRVAQLMQSAKRVKLSSKHSCAAPTNAANMPLTAKPDASPSGQAPAATQPACTRATADSPAKRQARSPKLLTKVTRRQVPPQSLDASQSTADTKAPSRAELTSGSGKSESASAESAAPQLDCVAGDYTTEPEAAEHAARSAQQHPAAVAVHSILQRFMDEQSAAKSVQVPARTCTPAPATPAKHLAGRLYPAAEHSPSPTRAAPDTGACAGGMQPLKSNAGKQQASSPQQNLPSPTLLCPSSTAEAERSPLQHTATADTHRSFSSRDPRLAAQPHLQQQACNVQPEAVCEVVAASHVDTGASLQAVEGLLTGARQQEGHGTLPAIAQVSLVCNLDHCGQQSHIRCDSASACQVCISAKQAEPY